MSVQCIPPILWLNVAPSSKNEPVFTMLGSVIVLCLFFLTLGQARSRLCHIRSVCSSHLVCSTHLADKRGALEQARTSLDDVCSVIVLCLFFLTLGHARSHLCHVRSVCFFHLVCFTHLVDKRGALEQERTSLYHVGSVKVFCETDGISWQLARFWKLASDKSLGEKLKICSLQLAVCKALGVNEPNKSHL